MSNSIVFGNSKLYPRFSIEQRAIDMFLRDSKASRKVKNFLEKSQACEKLLQMISKSRGSIFRGMGK